jgi:hypothetical protein
MQKIMVGPTNKIDALYLLLCSFSSKFFHFFQNLNFKICFAFEICRFIAIRMSVQNQYKQIKTQVH